MSCSFNMEFPGTEAQKQANYRTHSFDGLDGRCYDCDCRPGTLADWPCGFNVPRVALPCPMPKTHAYKMAFLGKCSYCGDMAPSVALALLEA